MSSVESTVESVSENNVVIKPTGILKVERGSQHKIKKKIHFSETEEGIIIPSRLQIYETEEVNIILGRLQEYQAYLAFHKALEDRDKTRLQSGIFFSFDSKWDLLVLVVPKEEENKITQFNFSEHLRKYPRSETVQEDIENYIEELHYSYFKLIPDDNKGPIDLDLQPVELGDNILEIIAERIKNDKVRRFTADVSSTIMRQERESLFAHYTWMLIPCSDLGHIKSEALPGFYIYRDVDAKIYALVKHTNEQEVIENGEKKVKEAETETICLSDIAQAVGKKDLVNDIEEKDLEELQSKLVSLVAPQCKKSFIRIPMSHDKYYPLHVFQFSYSKAHDFVETYFLDASIRFIITLEDIFFEKSRRNVVAQNNIEEYDVEESVRDLFLEEINFLEPNYDKNDMVLYFFDKNTPPELLKRIDEDKEKGLRVIDVEVTDNTKPIDIISVIDKVKLIYRVSKEELAIKWIKAQFAWRASSKTTGGKNDSGRQQKTILSQLIQLYIIVNSRSQSRQKESFIFWLCQCEDSFYRTKNERERAKIIKHVVKEIKKLYISDYSGGEVQSLEAQKEKESVPIDESNQPMSYGAIVAEDVALIKSLAPENSFVAESTPPAVDGAESSGSEQDKGKSTVFSFWQDPQPLDASGAGIPPNSAPGSKNLYNSA